MAAGSKTIDRVGAILHALEQGPAEGMTSTEIAAATGFDKATAYRALVSLERTRLVDRNTVQRRFKLGLYLFTLGAAVAQRFSVLVQARELVASIAKETGDTVYLSVRNKYQSVCIESATGSYPIKAHTLAVGESLPLGASTGGVAMLATMRDEDVRHAMQFNALEISKLRSIRPEQIYEQVELARARGYSEYRGLVVAGLAGVACAIRDAKGQGIAVISVTAVSERMNEARVKAIVRLLQDGIVAIEQRLHLSGLESRPFRL